MCYLLILICIVDLIGEGTSQLCIVGFSGKASRQDQVRVEEVFLSLSQLFHMLNRFDGAHPLGTDTLM